MDWRADLDLKRAIKNLRGVAKGDWYRDPWAWPEYQHLLDTGGDILWKELDRPHLARAISPIEVPKENFGVRPAVQLDISEHVVYQLMVDHVSADALRELRPDAFGWRHPKTSPPRPGFYARNDFQWRSYRGRLSDLAGEYPYGLKTDITSFFASIPTDRLLDELAARSPAIPVVDRIGSLLQGWSGNAGHSGLPQRSLASAVLANMYMQHTDEVIAEHATPSHPARGRTAGMSNFTRWMDDMWLFHSDPSALRVAQVELQRELRNLGLILNSAKTQLLEGSDMRSKARKVETSAVDNALFLEARSEPLEQVIDQVLDQMEVADGTIIKFVATRMRRWDIDYRVDDLLEAAGRFPHAADSLSRLFRKQISVGTMQDWFLDYLANQWSCFEWSSAQFGTAIPSRRRPQRRTITAFERMLAADSRSLPAVALAAQRLAAWTPDTARALIRVRIANEADPLIVRVLALSALQCGERPATVRRWLRPFRETQLTVQMLSARSFAPLPVTSDYR